MEQIKKTEEAGKNENESSFLKQELIEKEEVIKKLKEENEKLKSDLIHDGLTGLKTRKYLLEEIEKYSAVINNPEAEKRKENKKNFSILFCDIDNFKKLNDNLGHNFGDEILKEVSSILRKNLRGTDVVCRWGGEEIVISLFGADEERAFKKADNLRELIENGIAGKYGSQFKESELKVSMSIGVASAEAGLLMDDLIKRGDRAMYLAKEEGKNCVKTYSQVLEKEKAERNKL